MRVFGPTSERAALAIYLQDHHAGAQAGLALARRAASNQRGSRAGAALAQLAREIEEDERVLEQVMDHLGVRPSPPKDLGAKVLELLGRGKLNGQLLGTSPLSPVIELEGLLSGVKSKQHVWMVLRDAVDLPIPADPDEMIARADDQLERLHELWGEAARDAFP